MQEAPITILIIIATVGFSFWTWNNPDKHAKYIFNPYVTYHYKQYIRMLTSGFMHGDYFHLAVNMYVLYNFGSIIEHTFGIWGPIGKLIYVVFYLTAIVVSDIPTFLKYKDAPHYSSLGASGAVSAMLFAFIIIYPTQKLSLLFIPIGIPAFVFGPLYLAYSVYSSKKMADNINHDAHFFGAVYGIIFILATIPEVFRSLIYQVFGIVI